MNLDLTLRLVDAVTAEIKHLRELLAQTQGSIRLLAEELESGADPLDVARRMHKGADHLFTSLNS
jgi:hypothetical protein